MAKKKKAVPYISQTINIFLGSNSIHARQEAESHTENLNNPDPADTETTNNPDTDYETAAGAAESQPDNEEQTNTETAKPQSDNEEQATVLEIRQHRISIDSANIHIHRIHSRAEMGVQATEKETAKSQSETKNKLPKYMLIVIAIGLISVSIGNTIDKTIGDYLVKIYISTLIMACVFLSLNAVRYVSKSPVIKYTLIFLSIVLFIIGISPIVLTYDSNSSSWILSRKELLATGLSIALTLVLEKFTNEAMKPQSQSEVQNNPK